MAAEGRAGAAGAGGVGSGGAGVRVESGPGSGEDKNDSQPIVQREVEGRGGGREMGGVWASE